MSDLLSIHCHACHVGMKVKPEYIGKIKKCPKCGAIFIIPHRDGNTIPPSEELLAQLRKQAEAQKAAQAVSQTVSQAASQVVGKTVSSSTNQTVQTSEKTPVSPVSRSDSTIPQNPKIEISDEETIQPVEHPKRLDPKFRYIILNSERLVACWQFNTGWQVNDGQKLVSAKRSAQNLPKEGDFRFLELQLGEMDGEFRITKLRIFQLAKQYSVTKIAGGENEVLSTITSNAGLTYSQKNALLQGLKTHFMRSVWADSPKIYEYLFNDDFHSCEIG